jgi:hypothetical protein
MTGGNVDIPVVGSLAQGLVTRTTGWLACALAALRWMRYMACFHSLNCSPHRVGCAGGV